MEEEAREILRAGVDDKNVRQSSLVEAIRQHMEPLGGVELIIPPREGVVKLPKLPK
jgi:plasmid stability protein